MGQVATRSKAMAVRQRRYSKEELARRGQELYEASIRQQVESGNTDKIVANANGQRQVKSPI